MGELDGWLICLKELSLAMLISQKLTCLKNSLIKLKGIQFVLLVMQQLGLYKDLSDILEVIWKKELITIKQIIQNSRDKEKLFQTYQTQMVIEIILLIIKIPSI